MGGGQPLYNYFIEKAMKLSDNIVMITSNSWMTSDLLKVTRKNMIDFGIERIINYPVADEVFRGVSATVATIKLTRGIKDTKYQLIKSGELTEEYIQNLRELKLIPCSNLELSIIKKITTNKTFENQVVAKMPFGIESGGKLGTSSMSPYIQTSVIQTDDFNIPILFMDKQLPVYQYTTLEEIPKNIELIKEYKILCVRVLHKNKNVITNIQALPAGAICAGSYDILYHSLDINKAGAAYKYVNTRFLDLQFT